MNQNHQTKETYKREQMKRFQEFQADQFRLLEEQDKSVAAVYESKKRGNQRLMENYAHSLVETRKSCENKSIASFKRTDVYEQQIQQMESKEKIMMDELQNTVRKTQCLIDDLSRKSVSVTNQLIARNPIQASTPKYPAHSQYSYRKKNLANAKQEFEIKLIERVLKSKGVNI